jgi:fructosamine-3-kinase
MHQQLVDAIGAALDAAVVEARSLAGGDVARSYRVTLDDGRVVFAKTHDRPPPGFFVTEAWGLEWMRQTGAVDVPRVLAVGDAPLAMLVLTWVDERRGAQPDHPAGDRAFGLSLARMHRAGAPCFGREDRRPTGSRSLPNDPSSTWPEFYAQRRLLPLVRMAADGDAVDRGVLRQIEVIAGRLDAFGAADEPPARLHGDLWAGNRIVDRAGTSWLIDPAAHGGHREYDLAMMRVFGGFGPDTFRAYDDEYPLTAGWQRRVPLHQLAPLLVHAIKFGGGYRAAVGRATAALVSGSSPIS